MVMTRQSFAVHMCVLSAFYISGSHGNGTTTLFPQTVEAAENSNVTLTCSYSDQNAGAFQSGIFQWTFIIPGQEANNTFNVYVSNTNCQDQLLRGWIANKTLYSYRCISDTSHSVTLINVNQQRHGEMWSCGFWDGLQFLLLSRSSNVSVLVKVAVKLVTVSPHTSILTIAENASIDVNCTSSPCRLMPKFRWYITNDDNPDGTAKILFESDPIESESNTIRSYTSRLSITPNRTWNDRFYFCGANNSDKDFVFSAKILINVTYPPDGPPRIGTFGNRSEIKIIKDSFVVLKCLSIGGNPLPRLEWNKGYQMQQIVSGSTVTRDMTWKAVDIKKDELICQSIQSAMNYSTYVSVNVLYPPDEPAIKVKSALKEYTPVTGTLSVIEGLSFTLSCSASSNPPVFSYKWNDMPPSSSPVMDIANVTRQSTTVTCIVSNVMQTNNPNESLNGINKTSLTLDVLYPPMMNSMINTTVKEGDNIDYSCDFVNGNPGVTAVTWTGMNHSSSGQQLQLKNVSKQQEGLYRCTVVNFMSSWDGIQVVGNVSGEFYLSVHVYGNDGSLAASSGVSVVAASVAWTVVVVVIVVAVIIMIYRKRKRLSCQKRDVSIQCYNNQAFTDAELNISSDTYDQQYEQISPITLNIETDAELNISSDIYDQQYEQISPITSNIETDAELNISSDIYDQQYEQISPITSNIETDAEVNISSDIYGEVSS